MATIERVPQNVHSEPQKPTFHDLQKSADAGLMRKALARYLVPRNPDKSVKRYERVGIKRVKKRVMRRFYAPHYHLNAKQSPIEAATDYALRESASNELPHTISAVATGGTSIFLFNALSTLELGQTGHVIVDVATALVGGAATSYELMLVGLQRYNRARMVRFVDRQLARGVTYEPQYRNNFGIDARAVNNFQTKQSK